MKNNFDLRSLDNAIAHILLRRGQLETRMILLRRWQDVRDGRFRHELIKPSTQLRHAGGGRDATTGRPQRRDA